MPAGKPFSPAARLPDCYAKAPGTNSDKLLGAGGALLDEARRAVADTGRMLDLDEAFGKTLDLYGELAGQPRQGMADIPYRYHIRSRVARNLVAGDYESVLGGLANIFGTDKKTLVLDDHPEKPGVVFVTRFPLAVLAPSQLGVAGVLAAITRLLPVGVRVEAEQFEGTFTFAAGEGEEDRQAGFSDHPVPEMQGMGGYLGLAYGEAEDALAPGLWKRKGEES